MPVPQPKLQKWLDPQHSPHRKELPSLHLKILESYCFIFSPIHKPTSPRHSKHILGTMRQLGKRFVKIKVFRLTVATSPKTSQSTVSSRLRGGKLICLGRLEEMLRGLTLPI